jgi:hypothetical protein
MDEIAMKTDDTKSPQQRQRKGMQQLSRIKRRIHRSEALRETEQIIDVESL